MLMMGEKNYEWLLEILQLLLQINTSIHMTFIPLAIE